MTLTKEDLKKAIQDNLDIPKTQSNTLIESFLETIKSSLESGEDVMISGFGKFSVQNKKERRGRNPKTGEDIVIEPRKVVAFSCSGKLGERMNGKRPSPSMKD
jgi:integration host factor subunit alpha